MGRQIKTTVSKKIRESWFCSGSAEPTIVHRVKCTHNPWLGSPFNAAAALIFVVLISII